VVLDGAEEDRGRLLDVNITRTGNFTLYGEVASASADGASRVTGG
jgi:hypothetical protein